MNRLRQRLFVRSLEDRIVPALFTVTNLNDSGAGTLRQAVLSANGAAGADTIDFSVALPGTIFLTSSELAITGTSALTITGPGPGLLAVSGNNSSRIFNMTNAAAGMAISISGLELTAAKSTGQGGAILGDNQNLTLTNCRLTLNKITTTFGGAAVAMTAGGNFTATDCLFSGNSVGGFGGALNLFGNGTNATFTRCTISGNSAFAGGGLYVSGDLLINECTVSGNSASAFGGGMRLSNYYDATAAFTIRNSTISGNNGAEAGGIALTDFATTLTVQNSTLTENSTAGTGGGIRRISGAGGIILESTIVSGNTAATHPDVSSTGSVSMNFCAVGSNSGFTMTDKGGNLPFQPHTNLKLGLLLNNGGPTQTHRVAVDSPCVDSGNNPLSLTTDQRGTGFPRQVGKAVDIGAFELKPFVVTNLNDSGAGSLRQAAIDANGVAGQDVIEFAPGLTGIITLTSGEIALNEGVTIDGPGADVLTVNANKASRIFNTSGAPNTSLAVISIEGLTFTGGSVNAPGGAILGADETLAVTSCVFTGNSAKSGGAIALTTGGHFSAVFSRFIGNSASVIAGAITIEGVGSQAVIGACTISGNSAPQAGGLYARDNLRVGESTISGNTATNGAGGGIMAGGTFAPTTLQILNSTVSGNSAKFNGGGIILINFTGELPLQNSTVTNNTAGGPGGGISVANGPGTIAVESSIVFGNVNAFAPDISSANKVTVKNSVVSSSAGYNETDLGGNLPDGVDIKLGPLADNGGLTFTHQPAPDSPLIDAGSNPAAQPLDQRGKGFQRVIGDNIDIGAVETLSLVVRNANDSGLGSLRQTIAHANTHTGFDEITFDPGVFGTTFKSIHPTGSYKILEAVTISGPGRDLLTIDGLISMRPFNIAFAPFGTTITIRDLSIINGNAGTGSGGAIDGVDEILILENCFFASNRVADNNGGAVFMGPFGTVAAIRCDFVSNAINATTTDYGGGAIAATHLSLSDCTFQNNFIDNTQLVFPFVGGGAIAVMPGTGASLVVSGSSFLNNKAIHGGAIYQKTPGNMTITNCTISGNTATTGFGGGVYFAVPAGYANELAVRNCTITNNICDGNNKIYHGSGIHCVGPDINFVLESSIVAQNIYSERRVDIVVDSNSTTTIQANNSLIGIGDQGGFALAGVGNSTGTEASPLDAKLGPLADNGGPTLTHLPLNGSPAINAGNNKAGLTTDQRGFSRVVGTAADIGAVELQAPPRVAGVVVNDGAVQRSRVTSIRVDFDQRVTLPVNPFIAFQLERVSDNALVGLDAVVTVDAATHVTLTFKAGAIETGPGFVAPFSLQDGRYRLTIFAADVAGEGGQLDGDNNGAGGDNFLLVGTPANGLFRFFGDADGDGNVAANDFIQFRLALGGSTAMFDFDGDGAVAASDFIQFRLRFGGSI